MSRKFISIYITGSILFVLVFIFTLCLPLVAYAEVQQVTPGLHELLTKGLIAAYWIAVSIFGVIGMIVFADGFSYMWRTEDPAHVRKGWQRIFWGFVMCFSDILIVAFRDYIFSGQNISESLTKIWTVFL